MLILKAVPTIKYWIYFIFANDALRNEYKTAKRICLRKTKAICFCYKIKPIYLEYLNTKKWDFMISYEGSKQE